MKLFGLTFVIQKEVLDNFSINNIFFLSLCSKNTKEFIMHMQKYQFQKIEQIDYQIRPSSYKSIDRGSDAIMWLFETKAAFGRVLKGFESLAKVRVNELGIDFFRAPNSLTDLHAQYCYGNLEAIIEPIHGHLSALFGNHTKFWLYSAGMSHYLPILPNIQRLDIVGKCFEPTQIDRFLSESTCLECFKWSTWKRQKIELKEKSKIYQLDTVDLRIGHSLANDVLRNFNGRHAFLSGEKIRTTDVIQFLNTWKEGEKYQNLEVISIYPFYLNIPKIRRFVEFKAVKARVLYPFIKRFEQRNLAFADNDPWEFRSQFYMIRKSDGHVASVLLTDDRIFMGVWKMTEKEFLEKLEQEGYDVFF